MVKKLTTLLLVILGLIILEQQSFNGRMKESFTYDYGDHKEYVDFSFDGIIYSYHHYLTYNNAVQHQPEMMIFNQDVSGFFFRLGHYYFMFPLKKHCYLGCELGLSLLDVSLVDVFYINKINKNNTVLLLPERGVAVISACKHTLSSLLLSYRGLKE